MERTMYYGKGDVWVYRTYAKPLQGISKIPESLFTGRSNIIFGMNIKVAVEGREFLTTYTEGDNKNLVATDSMKNFILRYAGQYEGSTLEGFLEFVSCRFLKTYPQMTGIRISGKQIPFDELPISNEKESAPSDLVFRYSLNEQACAAMEVKRLKNELAIIAHSSSIKGLKLIKVKGSSFVGYVKDDYTTLPEAYDRPLYIFLDISWVYEEVDDAAGEKPERYTAAEQIRDIAYTVFHEQNSPSIQNLIYHIGLRILTRFPQLKEVRFKSNNRTWETVLDEIPVSSKGKVFTEPRPPYGFQGFSMTKKDLENKGDKEK
jgi:urate oxidase / 2-oxo-4-hydroxy-4-carboxy-5-ureidoimidazoline decarboxylase